MLRIFHRGHTNKPILRKRTRHFRELAAANSGRGWRDHDCGSGDTERLAAGSEDAHDEGLRPLKIGQGQEMAMEFPPGCQAILAAPRFA